MKRELLVYELVTVTMILTMIPHIKGSKRFQNKTLLPRAWHRFWW